MFWFPEVKLSLAQQLSMKVVQSGNLPQHISFIMDGNRRFAKNNNIGILDAHKAGFRNVGKVFALCRMLGVNEATFYLFSIENFKRTPQEVETLMKLMANKMNEVLTIERDVCMKIGVRFRFFGDVSLLPDYVQKPILEVARLTKNNDKAYFNLAVSYTAREEIAQAIKSVVTGVEQGELEMSDITQQLLSRCLYSAPASHPELLIRTSGEVRLSDFLLWQLSCSYLQFDKVMWPEFDMWNLLAAMVKYQRNYKQLQPVKKFEQAMEGGLNERCERFCERLPVDRFEKLLQLLQAQM